MKILIIDSSPGFTGAFKCAWGEANLLSGKHQFVFIVPESSSNVEFLKKQGLPVYQLPLKELRRNIKSILSYPFSLIQNLFRLRKIIVRENIELVQVNDFYNLLGAGLKMMGVKIKLITYVRFLPSSLPAALKNIWIKAAHQYSDKIIAVSDAVQNQLPKHAHTIRIYDPIALDEKYPQTSFDNHGKQFLFLANFTRGKGQEHALEAFIHIHKKYPEATLKFVGGDLGLEKNRVFRKELAARVKENKIHDVVSFHDFEPDVEKLIKSSYALLNFSEAESFSMTCLEASFYQTPVIATKCGGPEEIIRHENTGFLVDKKNIAQMAAAMERLLKNEDLRNEYAKSARLYVAEKFSKELFLKQFQEMLNRL